MLKNKLIANFVKVNIQKDIIGKIQNPIKLEQKYQMQGFL